MEVIVKEALNLDFMEKLGGQGGGCVCSGQGYDTSIGPIYVKYCNKPVSEAEVIFDGEFASLTALHNTGVVKVPEPLKVCKSPDNICLVTGYLDMDSLKKNRELGLKMADLHMHNSTQKNNSSVHNKVDYIDKFGFDVATCCGVIPQPNEWKENWVDFFTQQKLQVQIDMVLRDTGDREVKELWPKLVRNIPKILDVAVEPALLHGDLWGGNVAQVGEEPCIFDPASFYGHSEFDLAISMMFGGFSSAFFDAYFSRLPKDKGFDKRNRLYQLFHYLNHWNHFGSGYRGQSLGIIRELC